MFAQASTATAILFILMALTLAAGCSGGGDESPAPPTPEQLASATYAGVFDDPVTLVDGRWDGEPFDPEGASHPMVTLLETPPLCLHMEGEPGDVAAVLLEENSGGTGRFIYLAMVGIRDNEPVNMGTVLIGDRVQLRSMNGDQARLVLELLEAGPDDGMCCPSRLTSRVYALGADGLGLVETEEQGTLSLDLLAGKDWNLAGTTVTARFEDGQVSGFSGCNQYSGTVTETDPGNITIGPIAGTRKMCTETEMEVEQNYLRQLQSVGGYGFYLGRLALTTAEGDSLLLE